jgi:hypothetical protein
MKTGQFMCYNSGHFMCSQQEWDFMATKKFGQHYMLLAKYAYYDADQYNTDTHKIWLQANVNF